MTKYKNPFYTIWEMLAVLKSAGASPMNNLPEGEFDWREEVLSVKTSRVYDEAYEHYFEVEIHVAKEAFDRLKELTGTEVTKRPHSDEYDYLAMRPSDLIEIFTLVPKEVETT